MSSAVEGETRFPTTPLPPNSGSFTPPDMGEKQRGKGEKAQFGQGTWTQERKRISASIARMERTSY